MDISRRFFLKAVAALSTVPLIKVPDFRLMSPGGILLPGEQWFTTVREISVYDQFRDQWIYRWDLYDGANQWSVDAAVSTPSDLEESRHAASILFRDSLRADGIDVRNLKPLPPYPGIQSQVGMRPSRSDARLLLAAS